MSDAPWSCAPLKRRALELRIAKRRALELRIVEPTRPGGWHLGNPPFAGQHR